MVKTLAPRPSRFPRYRIGPWLVSLMPTAITKASGDRSTKPMIAAKRCQIGVEPPTTSTSVGTTVAGRTGSAADGTLRNRGGADALTGVCMLMGVSGASGSKVGRSVGRHRRVGGDGGRTRLPPHVVPVHEDE